MSIKRWVVPEVDKQAAAQLAEDCEIHPFLALLLVARGITDAESAADFILGGELGDDPFGITDMDVAVVRLQYALDNNEMIAVYGDYDADGVTATVLLYTYLKEKGANVVYYIPERGDEGYGLHHDSIDCLSKLGVNLIVTVDNGVSAAQEIDYATKNGIDVIVTDHHQPPDELPRAVAVVDPHRADCDGTYKDYAGVGLAFQLACALEGDSDKVLEEYGDLVALGTLADVVPLTGENRKLVKYGLSVLNQQKRLGIKALAKVAGYTDEFNSTSTAFTLAPRINAAGRMDSADLAVRLLLATTADEADDLACRIQKCNQLRQSTENDILREIIDRLRKRPRLLADRVLVLECEGWHDGVIGIIASRIVERYGKPCILISIKDNEAKGSGRSVVGFSLYDAVSACSSVLNRFGGHEMAAGISLQASDINEFRLRINEYAAKEYSEMPVPELRVDFKLRPSQVDIEKLSLISVLEPFGSRNPTPVFGLFGMTLDNIMPMGQGKHLRLSVSRDDARFSVVLFNQSWESFGFECGQTVNLVVTLKRNEFRGVVSPSVLLKDIRAVQTEQNQLIGSKQLFDILLRGDEIGPNDAAAMMPERVQLESTYKFLRSKNGWKGAFSQLCYYLKDIPCVRILVILEMLCQAGLIQYYDMGDIIEISLKPATKKADLTSTGVWRRLSSIIGKRVSENEQ